MQYITDKDLSEFKFWDGGVDRAKMFTGEELDAIGERLNEIFSTIPTEYEINDLFWFNVEKAAALIGLEVNEDEEIVR